MKEGRLHLRLNGLLLKQAKEVARRRGTTLTALVTSHLQQLIEAERVESGTQPIPVDAEQV